MIILLYIRVSYKVVKGVYVKIKYRNVVILKGYDFSGGLQLLWLGKNREERGIVLEEDRR